MNFSGILRRTQEYFSYEDKSHPQVDVGHVYQLQDDIEYRYERVNSASSKCLFGVI